MCQIINLCRNLLLPAVIRSTSCEIRQKLTIGHISGANLLNADHLLILDVEHQVPVVLLLLDVIIFDFH